MTSSVASLLPRVFVVQDFLDSSAHARLLEESLRSESAHSPRSVSNYDESAKNITDGADSNIRRSVVRRLPKDLSDLFKGKVLQDADRIAEQIGVAFPEQSKIEIEAVQNGDGAFFSAHTDTTRGPFASRRVISSVYYYSKTPKQFSGGALKLYSLDRSASLTVEPDDNTIVFFSSMFLHEVLPISLPSGAFEDGRFSVNCWVHKPI